jgi:hypothetical protein
VTYLHGREAEFLVARYREAAQADEEMKIYAGGAFAGTAMPFGGPRYVWILEEVPVGDGGLRFSYAFQDTFNAMYFFRIGSFVGGVLVSGSESDEPAIAEQVSDLAARQAARLVQMHVGR